MKKNEQVKIMGLMSGTSADGLSISLCAVPKKGKGLKVIVYETYDYELSLQKKILAAKSMKTGELSSLNFELGRVWAGMVKKFCSTTSTSYKDIAVIGSHGQTVYHEPGRHGSTLQIGEPSFISEETRRPVVADFRPMDMAAGGEGAPLIPFMDEYLFGGAEPVGLQNIGGVGNIAFVGKSVKTTGFDTGPGNSLMDTAIAMFTNGKIAYDKNGEWAAKGQPDYPKVEKFLKLPFFSVKPPKSLDRDEFSAVFIKKYFGRLSSINKYNVLATLNWFTAASIALAFKSFAPKGAKTLIVSGGGALNPELMANIARSLPKVKVNSIAEIGIHPLAKEPACFALLGWLALNQNINHCPSATGAHAHRVLGKIIL